MATIWLPQAAFLPYRIDRLTRPTDSDGKIKDTDNYSPCLAGAEGGREGGREKVELIFERRVYGV